VSLPAWKRSVKMGATYKSRTKMPLKFVHERYVVDVKRLRYGGGGGSRIMWPH
jgi:hypothetical protein